MRARTGIILRQLAASAAIGALWAALGGCSSGKAVTNEAFTEGLSIAPSVTTVSVGSHTTFSVTGGAAPYTFRLLSGSGSIGPKTGIYVASGVTGTAKVGVVDSSGALDIANITIVDGSTSSGLAISPSAATVAPSGTYTFSVTGGSAPYAFSVVSGGGSITSDGVYTAPSSTGSAQLQVADSSNAVAYAIVTISSNGGTLKISPAVVTIQPGGTQTFSATGGTAPYNFYIRSGQGTLGTSSGVFTAPASAGSTEIEVIDHAGYVAYAEVTIGAPAVLPDFATIYRLYNSSNQDHLYSTSSTEGTNLGFSLQGGAFKLVSNTGVSGTQALYRCRTTTIPQRHFLSPSSGCEGGITEFILGYAYTSPASGYQAIYRFISPNGHDRLATLNYYEGISAGYMLEGILGYGDSAG
jgi:plastocyanin